MRFKAVTVGVVLAGTALGSAAVTLGKARGAAWIGQSLELQVPVQRDAGQTDAALCVEADVFHGETRQDASRVQIQTEATSQSDVYNVRISSSALIDEPVVTVYLRAGCAQKASRKYVLLADFPPEPQSAAVRSTPAAPQVPTIAPPAMPIDNVQGAAGEPVAVAATSTRTDKAPKAKVVPQASPKPVVAAAPKAPKEVVQAKKEPTPSPAPKAEKPVEVASPPTKPSGKPRLRLDPVETLAERVKNLEATTTQTSLQDDLSRDAQKMQQLQSDLRTLLDQAVKNEASLAAMRERLEKAEADRVPVALVYGLVALVAVCVGALAFLWTRRGRPIRWEKSPAESSSPSSTETPQN